MQNDDSMAASTSSTPLWDFALVFYAQPQVAETCVQLQDAYDINVCLLIGLRWLDEQGAYLDAKDLADLQVHIRTWTQEVVVPLRSLRRRLKESIQPFAQDELQTHIRTAVKQAELLAEKKLLVAIEAWLLSRLPALAGDGQSTLAAYLSSKAVPSDAIELLQRPLIG